MLNCTAEEEQAIGIWGQRHLDYLKQYRKVTHQSSYKRQAKRLPADINRQAQERFERLIEGMETGTGHNGTAKGRKNALEWTGCLNNIRACAREIVEKEIIFA